MGSSRTKGTDLSVPSSRRDANENTQKVLEAACKVFKDKGFEATVEEIAAEAGVGVGTVHRRFSSKTVLAAAVVADIYTYIWNRQLEITKMNLPADTKMRLLFEEFTSFHSEYGKIYSTGLYLASKGEIGEEIRHSVLFGLQGAVSSVIEQGQTEGIFRSGDPQLLETLLINMINPHLILTLKEQIPPREVPKFISDQILLGLIQK